MTGGIPSEQLNALATALRTPRPWNLKAFSQELQRQYGHPVTLTPAPLPADHPGLLLTGAPAHTIAYPATADPARQAHVIAHQAAHLLLRHHGIPDDVLVQSAFPHLDPITVAQAITARKFAPQAEQEADALASLLIATALADDTKAEQDESPEHAGRTRQAARPAPKDHGSADFLTPRNHGSSA